MGLWSNSGGGEKGGALGFPVEQRITSSAKSEIQRLQRLPNNTSLGQLQQETRAAAKAEMRSAMLRMLVRQRTRQLNAAIADYGSHATWNKALLNAAVRTGRTDADFQKAIGLYQLGHGENQANFSGYQQALQGVSTLV